MTEEEKKTIKRAPKRLPYYLKSLERDAILFKWRAKTEGFKLPFQPELLLTIRGSYGWDKIHKCWVTGSWEEIRDENGDYITYLGETLSTTNKQVYQLKNHEEVIVCGNTPLYRPFEDERRFYSDLKTETDISIYSQIMLSRLSKAIVADSDNKKKQIEKAYENVKHGFPLVLVTSLLESLDVIELTDSDEIEKMQYLNSFYQSLQKREMNDIGVDLDIIDKRAQVSNKEITQYDDFTSLEYLIMYESRLAFVEEMKENGIEIECIRNPIFFDEPKKEDINEGTFEEAENEEPENVEGEEAPEENKEVEENGGNET